MDMTTLAVISTGLGAFGVQFIKLAYTAYKENKASNEIVARRKEASEDDAALSLRRVLQAQIDELKAEVRRQGDEIEFWRRKASDLEIQMTQLALSQSPCVKFECPNRVRLVS
jgi:anti-sigma-K factor RsiG